MRRRRPPRRTSRPRTPQGSSDAPSLRVLEEFDAASLSRWLQSADRLLHLHSALHFDLEPLRNQASADLVDALRQGATAPFEFQDWCRIVDWQYSLSPLSTVGSLQDIGGRFNVGNELNAATFTPFPALYIAEDYETALHEKFGRPLPGTRSDLSAAELALRKPASFTQCRLEGRLDSVIDVGDPAALKPFVDVIKSFAMPRTVPRLSRALGFKAPPGLIRSVGKLQQELLKPSWRTQPMQFDLPANSQVFARIAVAAGLHGILYPSSRQSSRRCLALFPQNWGGSRSYVETMDVGPAANRLRLDGTTSVS